MRITPVSFVDWVNERCGRVAGGAVLPPEWAYWRPNPVNKEIAEEAQPVPEPDKGLRFDAYA